MHNILHKAAVASVLSVTPFAWSNSDAAAQKLSDRPITIIVPYSPGTGPDILARLIGEEIQQRWGQPVVVDNKPGATGNIGTQIAARAAPDGHTLLMTTNPITANISLLKNVPYDPVKSFAPVIFVGTGALALAVHPSLPATSFQEFIDYVKARPGEINFGSPGVGGPHHLAMELLKLVTKTDMKHIPYRGSAGATNDLIGGHVSVAFQSIHVIMPMAQNNQVRLLAIASKERSRVAPESADLAGARARRLRGRFVVRGPGPGRHAAGDRRSLQRDDQRHSSRPSGDGETLKARVDYGRRQPRAISRLHRERHRQMAEGGNRSRDRR